MAQTLNREELLQDIAALGASEGLMADLAKFSTDEQLAATLQSATEQRDWYRACGFEPVDPITGQ